VKILAIWICIDSLCWPRRIVCYQQRVNQSEKNSCEHFVWRPVFGGN